MEATALVETVRLDVWKKCFRFKTYSLQAPSINILSISLPDHAFRVPNIPTRARGLFVYSQHPDSWRIAARGYDKFTNLNDSESDGKSTNNLTWAKINATALSPFHVTLKENGCVIHVAALHGHLLVTSKHAIGNEHSIKGREWLDLHLKKSGASHEELVQDLQSGNLTLVFELCDDSFEEHVLEYPQSKSGLYLHGINLNSVVFVTKPVQDVISFAKKYGFFHLDSQTFQTAQEVREFAELCGKSGSYKGKPIEGFVVRCQRLIDNEGHPFFFKIKFDKPYLMFREWRESTNEILRGLTSVQSKFRYQVTQDYVKWLEWKLVKFPELFEGFLQKKGIINTRNLYLKEVHNLDLVLDGEKIVELSSAVTNFIAPDSNGGSDKLLIIPISTIGAGKTTLAKLMRGFSESFGHIQNDNIKSAKGKFLFEKTVMDAFRTHSTVFADRNNHLEIHRLRLSEQFKAIYPNGRILALDWEIQNLPPQEVIDESIARVIRRGENHQTLTPSNPVFRKVAASFVRHRAPFDRRNNCDRLVDDVLRMNLSDCPIQHVKNLYKKIDNLLGTDLPDEEEIMIAWRKLSSEGCKI